MCIHLKDNCLKSYRSIHKSSLHLSKTVFCFLSSPYLLLFFLLLPLFFSNQFSSQNALAGKVNHLYSHEKVKIPYLSTTVFLSSLYLSLFSLIAPHSYHFPLLTLSFPTCINQNALKYNYFYSYK